MADTKITALTAITTVDPAVDVLPIVDVSDTTMAASGTTKKITSNQILGAGGTATLASATITGDLTVATDALKVNSSTKDICIGTTTPTFNNKLTVVGGAGGDAFITSGNGTRTGYIGTDGTNVIMGAYSNHPLRIHVNDYPQMEVAALGVFNWYDGAGGTRMTLNSTGLGIGASPTQKLHVKGVVNFEQVSGGTNGWQVYTYTDGTYRMNYNGAGADELIIDTSGNVGIGVTPSAWVSYQKAIDFGGAGNYGSVSARTDFSSFATNCYFNGTSWIYKNTYPAYSYEHTGGVHKWNTAPSGTAGNAITFTQAMTLDASGNLLVGVTSTTTPGVGNTTAGGSLNANGAAFFSHASSQALYLNTNVDGQIVSIRRSNVAVGSISVTTTGTTFNSLSDYRLKEAVAPLSGGLARISALKPSVYKWKADGSNGEGFLAHELAEVVPLAVTGEKDAVNDDGSIKAQGVDLSKVVPILVAAIKELAAEVNALKNA